MSEIKVILNADTDIDVGSLAYDMRELLFDQLADANPQIPRSCIDEFFTMQTEDLAMKSLEYKPELNELLLRKVIATATYGSKFNTLVIPIVALDYVFSITSDRTGDKSGGAMPPMRRMVGPMKKQNMETIAKGQRIRFDSATLCAHTTGGITYIAPPNEELDVVGVYINVVGDTPRVEDRPLTAVRYESPHIGDYIDLGNYTHIDCAKSADGYFIQPDQAITIAGRPMRASKIMFSDIDSTRVLGDLFDYLLQTTLRYINSGPFIYAQLGVYIRASPTVNDHRYPTGEYAVDSPNTQILALIEGIHYGKFARSHMATIDDIYSRGFAPIYISATLYGLDSPRTRDLITTYKAARVRNEFIFTSKVKARIAENIQAAYKRIIEKKFGSKRSHDIEHSAIVAHKPILDMLTRDERKAVELEYKKMLEYIEAIGRNQCAHVRVLARLRTARDNMNMSKMLNELKQFMAPSSPNTMITCKVCKHNIICPHVKEQIELELKGALYAVVKAAMSHYIEARVGDQFYCKICGEAVISLEVFGDMSGDRTDYMNEELKNFMWSEIAIITKYLKFGTVVNVPQLITAARDATYPYIFEIERQINKSKTNSADEIKAKKRLYTTIYAFAYFIHLVHGDKHSDISFKIPMGKGVNIPSLVDMVKFALDQIIISRNIIIREIPGISPDVIKNVLIEAYKAISSAGKAVAPVAGETEDLKSVILLNPIYRYFYDINIVSDAIGGKRPSLKATDRADKLEYIMGAPIAKLATLSLFKSARMPAIRHTRAFDDIKWTGKLAIDYDAMYSGYAARSFELFVGRLRAFDADKVDGSVAVDTKYNQFHEKELILLKYRNLAAAQNYCHRPTPVIATSPVTKLARIYDENGSPHRWDIYIIDGLGANAGKNGVTDGYKEYKSSDIQAVLAAGSTFNGTWTDRKCSVCGIKWSNLSALDDNKIRAQLHLRHQISNFFRFYENRCLKGGPHDWGNSTIKGSKCSKCSMLIEFITTTNSTQAIAFYQANRAVYTADKLITELSIAPPSVKTANVVDTTKFAAEYEKWAFNFNLVLDLANKLKINPRLISAMGAVEKVEYADILSGAYIPSPETESRMATRIFLIDGHIKNLITEYNMLKHFHRLVRPPLDLSALVDASGINKHRLSELGKTMPPELDVLGGYNERFAYIHATKKPRDITAWCIQSFCEMCLRIYDANGTETKRLRADFVEYIVKKIIRNEELVSKPGYFNWSLLYGDKDAKEGVDTNTSTETDTVAEPEDMPEDFGDTAAPMEANDFDMEEDPDDDPDDTGNEWRVGENLAMN